MRRSKHHDIFGGKWEYTLLQGGNFDKSRDPEPALLNWNGIDFPPIAYEINPQVSPEGTSGPWWLPLLLWNDEVFDSNVLCYSAFLGLIPVINVLALDKEIDVKTVAMKTVFVPHYSIQCEKAESHKSLLRSLMRDLVTHSNMKDSDEHYCAVIDALQKLRGTGDYETKFKLALMRFPYRTWIEGPLRLYTHPAIFYYSDYPLNNEEKNCNA